MVFEEQPNGYVRIMACPDGTDIRAALAEAAVGCQVVTMDLSGADVLDSEAIAKLISAYSIAREKGVEIRLECLSARMTRILQDSGLGAAFGLHPLQHPAPKQAPNRSTLRRQEWKLWESVVLAEPELVGVLREVAIDAAGEAGLSEEDVLDVRLSTGEALVNALRHGSSSTGNKIRLRCLSCPRAFVVEVVDQGAGWTEEDTSGGSTSPSGGLGIKLMKAAVDEVEFLTDENGFTVRMLKWLETPEE